MRTHGKKNNLAPREVRAARAVGNFISHHALIACAACLLLLVSAEVNAAPAFVQRNYAVPQSPQSIVTVPFIAAQNVGNLNVVVVGWNDSTAVVNSVTDSAGNVYARAVGPTVLAGWLSQSIYFAKNIAAAAASANVVTVQFNVPAQYVDIRVLEYGGLDPSNPVDVTATATGNSSTSSTPAAATTNANDLIFGANMVYTATRGPGASFVNRVITTPNGDIAEDRTIAVTGNYSVSAPLTSSGRWVMQMVAFRAATSGGGDTSPPTAPSALSATATGTTTINLGWTASTDNTGVTGYRVERCQGTGCSTFAQIGTTTGAVSYGDTGLVAGTSYSYRVRAADAAGNLSNYSNAASTTTNAVPDTTPPTAPSALSATATGTTTINLGWTASTDNTGVTGYRVERCQGTGCSTFAQIGTTTGAVSYGDTGLVAGTSYSYRVRAADAAGNLSNYSNTASTTTNAVPDTTPPTAPSALSATATGTTTISLGWTASTDNVGVTGYRVERCQGAGCSTFAQIGTTTGAVSYGDTGLVAGTSYSYRVRATDAAGNLSAYSNSASATTNQGSASPIAFIQGKYAVPQSPQSSLSVTYSGAQTAGNLNIVAVGWNDSTAAVTSVTDSKGNVYTRAVGPTVLAGWLSQSIYYAKNIAAAAANANAVTVQFNVPAQYADVRVLEYSGLDTANPIDVTAAATGTSATSSTPAVATTNANDLIFGANMVYTSTVGPGAGFAIRMTTSPNGDIGEDRVVTTTGSYNASATLSSSGPWVMQMAAFRAAAAVPDTTPPSAPSGLSAASAPGTINLNWGASTDNVAVTGYHVERCTGTGCASFAEIGTTTGAISYSDSAVISGSSYSYRVRANDAAGNLGGYSNTASATASTPDTTPPSAPSGLTATAVSASQINLSWIAASDNVAVTGYRVLRCQDSGAGADCPNFAKVFQLSGTGTTYSDTTGLAANTTYRYEVRALDGAGNIGPASNDATATTLGAPSGLVAAYAFDEGSGTIVSDTSGNANTGTLANPTWTTAGKYGSALVFNGSNAAVAIPDAPTLRLSTGMTLEAWVNRSNATVGWSDVIYKGNDNYYLEGTSTDGGAPAGGGTFGGTGANVAAGSALPLNTWSHLAITYDGSSLTLYVNGILVASAGQSGAILASSNPLQIGGDSIYGQYFEGLIDEVRVYNRALSQSEIQSDMNTPIGFNPTPPANLTATPVGANEVDLNWAASVARLPIASYSVERCQGSGCTNFAQIATTTGTTFSDMTVIGGGTYEYRVRATDQGGNSSAYSNVAEAYTGLAVVPRATTLTFTGTQQFGVIAAGTGGVLWFIDGIAGGTATTGTITSGGLYTPPAAVGTHTVTATLSDHSQSANATAYISNYPGTTTHLNDNFRTGQNLGETVLSLSNVNTGKFGKLFSYPLDGAAYASPLYLANVAIPGQGFHNVVYIATEHDSVYAFDADGRSGSALWHASFINPAAGVTPVPAIDTGECCDITDEIGISGTPVIDASSGTLYVVAKTKEPAGYVQRLHALDTKTGAEKFGGPVVIQASVPGTGTGSQGGRVPFDALRENQRPALLLSNGVVYIAFGSHGDQQPYHGWVLGYNATTLQQVMAYNVTANGSGAGIWQSGAGAAADSAGNVYFITANGTFDANTGGVNYGDSFVKLSPGGTVLDYFTPHNQASLASSNYDLASSGPLLLPDQPGAHPHLMLSAGKNETIHMVDRDSMGHYNASNDNQIVQSLVNIFPNGTPEPGNYNAAIYYKGTVYFSPVNDTLMAFGLTNGLLSTSPTSRSSAVYTYPGGAIAVSANGNANGILWAVQRNSVSAPGVLRAYDATNLATELYNSNQAGTRDTLDFAVKFSIPLVANGKVFIGSMSQLTVYGLLQ